MRRFTIVTIAAGLVLVGCASEGVDSQVDPTPVDSSAPATGDLPVASVDPAEGPAGGTVSIDVLESGPDLALETDLAIADLRSAPGIDGTIDVVSVHEVTWPDGSLDCPEPGVLYTREPIDGYRIVLEIGSQRFEYHGAVGSEPIRCDEHQVTSAGPSSGTEASPGASPGTEDPLELEPVKPPVETEPTEELGGPGGPPDE